MKLDYDIETGAKPTHESTKLLGDVISFKFDLFRIKFESNPTAAANYQGLSTGDMILIKNTQI